MLINNNRNKAAKKIRKTKENKENKRKQKKTKGKYENRDGKITTYPIHSHLIVLAIFYVFVK